MQVMYILIWLALFCNEVWEGGTP